MKEVIKIIKYLFCKLFSFFARHGCFHWINDETYLKIIYFSKFKDNLNLYSPHTFNEKLQWLKLYDRKKIYTEMVDKYEAKKYVSKRIGEKYVIPTLGIYSSFEEIDFSDLPEQFVIKTTHDSGGVVICKNKNSFDLKKAEKKINKSLSNNYYYSGREWPYKNVKPRIIIEEYKEDREDNELRDYKMFCFNGIFRMMFIATNRQGNGETCFDFFDRDFNHLPFTNGHPNALILPHKPNNYDLMIELAEKISKDIPQVRIDFYDVNGKVYFGEITFFHWSGFTPFSPNDWDKKLGELIKLPKKEGKDEIHN